MNLENLNLVELSAQEVRETEGGLAWYVWVSLSLMAEAAINGAIDGIRDAAAQGKN